MNHFGYEAKILAAQKSSELLAMDVSNLNEKQLNKVLDELSELIALCRKSYYQENISLVSDTTYDKLVDMQYDIFGMHGKTNQ